MKTNLLEGFPFIQVAQKQLDKKKLAANAKPQLSNIGSQPRHALAFPDTLAPFIFFRRMRRVAWASKTNEKLDPKMA